MAMDNISEFTTGMAPEDKDSFNKWVRERINEFADPLQKLAAEMPRVFLERILEDALDDYYDELEWN